MSLKVEILPALGDNYIYVIVSEKSKKSLVVDPGEAKPVEDFLISQQLTLDGILMTHFHWDHKGGALELLKKYNPALFIGCSEDPRCDDEFKSTHINLPESFTWEGHKINSLSHPGHTAKDINYHFVNQDILFTGDTLFGMGCGRIFPDGDASTLYESHQKIKALPKNTLIYCTHEYTLSNGQFAKHCEPSNADIQERLLKSQKLRDQGLPTIPFTLLDELKTNPFLRTHTIEIKQLTDTDGCSDKDTFIKLRALKDRF